MVTLDLLVLALIGEALILLILAVVWYRLKFRRLDARIRAYLQRRRQFLTLLEETRTAVKATRKHAIADWAQRHQGQEEAGRAIEDARLEYLDQCIETCKECDGELYRFWNGSYGSLYSILAELSEKLEQIDNRSAEPPERADLQDEDAEDTDFDELFDAVDADDAVTLPKDAGEDARIAELERVVRYQSGKLSELNEFRWRYEELTNQFVNIRASNERLKNTLYDLLWKQENASEQEGGHDTKALEEAMAEFERSNKEMAMCLSTLEEENARLKNQVETIDEEQEAYIVAVSSHEGDSVEHLANQVEQLENTLAEQRKSNEQLQAELKDLQREYVALYAQQQAAAEAKS
jgi:uncharacterized protein YukE